MELDIAVKITLIIVLITVAILCIVAAFSLKSFIKFLNDTSVSVNKTLLELNSSLRTLTQDISDIKNVLVYTLDKVNHTIDSVNSTVDKIEKQADELINIFKPFQLLIDEFISKIAKPIANIVSWVSASNRAINTFSSFFSGKNKNKIQ